MCSVGCCGAPFGGADCDGHGIVHCARGLEFQFFKRKVGCCRRVAATVLGNEAHDLQHGDYRDPYLLALIAVVPVSYSGGLSARGP